MLPCNSIEWWFTINPGYLFSTAWLKKNQGLTKTRKTRKTDLILVLCDPGIVKKQLLIEKTRQRTAAGLSCIDVILGNQLHRIFAMLRGMPWADKVMSTGRGSWSGQNRSRHLGYFNQKRQKRTSRMGNKPPNREESNRDLHICVFAWYSTRSEFPADCGLPKLAVVTKKWVLWRSRRCRMNKQ